MNDERWALSDELSLMHRSSFIVHRSKRRAEMKDHTKRPDRGWLVHGGVLVAGLLAHGWAPAQSCSGPGCAQAMGVQGMPADAMVGINRYNRCPTMPKGAIPAPPGAH